MCIRDRPTGDPAKIAGSLVFSLSAVALYAASTLFHSTRGRFKRLWECADHCAIYLLIAGTYTPFALVMLEGAWAWVPLLAMWGAAAVGIRRELMAARGAPVKPSLPLYIGMGWLAIAAAVPLAMQLEGGGLAWLLIGAVLYLSLIHI